jgi:amino acid adenylation domain-containing protein
MSTTSLPDVRDKRRALMQRMSKSGLSSPVLGGIPPREPNRPAPLSFSQERMWFLDQLVPGSPFYVESSAIRLSGRVDPSTLERAINAVIARHEVLRTSIVLVEDRPVQIVTSTLYVPLPVTDLSGMPEPDLSQELESLISSQSLQPFDLATAPLLRIRLILLAEGEQVFALTVHHIISDGWSMRVFSEEVNEHYAAFAGKRPARVPALPIQYGDFAQWQREGLNDSAIEAQLSYWRRQLSDAPELNLPLDYPRPKVLGYRGAHLDVRLPLRLSAALRAVSRREEVTLFMSALAAFAALLGFYCGQEDIVIGVPIAGRTRPEVESLIGLFLNTIVVRVDLSGDPSYRELLSRVKSTALEAYGNQDVPFDRLVEELSPHRDLGRNPLFQVLFQFFTPPRERIGTAGAEADAVSFDRGAAALDLSFHLWDTPAGIAGRLEYSVEVFQPATIERLFQNYLELLAAVLADAHRPLSHICPLTPAEREQVLQHWQGEPLELPQDTLLHEIFRQRAEATPNAVAVIADGHQTSFAELERSANRLARYLHAQGIGHGERVAICLQRSTAMVVAMLAVLKAGAAFVPLDPSYPIERLRYLLQDSGARALIAGPAQDQRLSVPDQSWRVIDPTDPAIVACLSDPLSPAGRPLDVAYVIYTSGSTGLPKGVMGLHRATINRFVWMWQAFPFAEGETTCQKTAVSFVDAIWEILGPLLAGVPLVIIPDELVRDPAALVGSLASHGVTRLLVVPSLLSMLLDSRVDLVVHLPKLRWWFTSGERIPAELASRFAEAVPHGTLVNLYGSSEAAGDITCDVVTDSTLAEVPIGRPIANSRAYVLDHHMQPVPPGLAGYLYVAGPNLARGYLDRPGLTAERFLPDPFASDPGERMYATGDRVRHLPDGRLEFIGRLDQQIKLRGHRIELGEVEMVLTDAPRVRAAVTLLHEDGAGGRLVAYITPELEPAAIDEVRRFLAARLPPYVLPSAIMPLPAFPLLPNGKLDRAALRALDTAESIDKALIYTPPRTDTEHAMALIWQELLKVNRIGIADNFFHLGGHSLLATRLISRVRQDIGLDVPLTEIFLRPTLAEFSEAIETLLLGEIEDLSDEQARLWLRQHDGAAP